MTSLQSKYEMKLMVLTDLAPVCKKAERESGDYGRATRAGPTTIAAGVLWAHLMNCQGGNREKTDYSGIDRGIVDAGQADG